jgi:hypothetical protein
MVCGQPIYVFRELLHYLTEHRLLAPGYSFLQETVGKALLEEQQRLITLIPQHLTPAETAALNLLLEEAQGLYEITLLKREPKDFSWRELAREIRRGQQLHPFYELARRLLPHLHISNESIKYYASLVTYYSVFRLKQLDERLVHVYLLCFVSHRYQRLHDHLITSLIYHVRRYADAAKDAAKERVYTSRVEGNDHVHKAGQVLKLFTDGNIAPQTPFQDVQTHAFGILERPKLEFIADHLATHARFDETAFQWDHLDQLAPQFKRHVRPLLLAVDFAATSAHAPLITAVHFLRTAFQKGRSLGHYPSDTFPTRFIPETLKRYLYTQQWFGQNQAAIAP